MQNSRVRAVALLGAPANSHNFGRMGIKALNDAFDITILDLTPLLGRDFGKTSADPDFKLLSITSLDELRSALAEIRPKFALDFVGIDASGYSKICRALEPTHTDLVVVKDASVPSPGKLKTLFSLAGEKILGSFASQKESPEGTISRKKPMSSNSNVLEKIETICWGLTTRQLRTLGVFAGTRSFDVNSWYVRSKIWAKSEDMHAYERRVPSDVSLLSAGKIVFLDSPIADGADWMALSQKPLVSADIYYPLLRNFFDELEQYSNMEVIVAGHPNHKESKHFVNDVGDRKVIFDSTAELVAGAELVVTSGSTAISFGILAKKRLLFLATEEIYKSRFDGPMLIKMAKLLKRPILRIDRPLTSLNRAALRPVHEGAYSKYIDSFLCRTGTKETSQWESLITFAEKTYGVNNAP